jgi:hypothetical protein
MRVKFNQELEERHLKIAYLNTIKHELNTTVKIIYIIHNIILDK